MWIEKRNCLRRTTATRLWCLVLAKNAWCKHLVDHQMHRSIERCLLWCKVLGSDERKVTGAREIRNEEEQRLPALCCENQVVSWTCSSILQISSDSCSAGKWKKRSILNLQKQSRIEKFLHHFLSFSSWRSLKPTISAAALHFALATSWVVPWISGRSKSFETSWKGS